MHNCHAKGCGVPVDPKMFMCPKHWKDLPWRLRIDIWRHYRAGQEITKDPSDEYMEAADRAITWTEGAKRE